MWKRMKLWAAAMAVALGASALPALAVDPTPADAVGYVTAPFYTALPTVVPVLIGVMLVVWAIVVGKSYIKRKI